MKVGDKYKLRDFLVSVDDFVETVMDIDFKVTYCDDEEVTLVSTEFIRCITKKEAFR